MLSSRCLATALLLTALPACSSNDAASKGTSTPEPEAYPAPVANECVTDLTAASTPLAIECSGLKGKLTVPDRCLTERCGLVVDVHGFVMDADLQDLHTHFRALATAEGYIVLQPTAPGAALQTRWSPDNDAQVYEMIQKVMEAWHPDPKRVHFGGYSMGGWMTWRFVCNHPELIASAAPIAAGASGPGQSCAFSGEEMPAEEVPVFYTHGTTDGLVVYSTATQMRDAVVAGWDMTQTEVVASGPDFERVRYESPSGNVFEFAHHDWQCNFTLGTIALKGHCFPGSKEVVGCGEDNAFSWPVEVLKFYQAHPKP